MQMTRLTKNGKTVEYGIDGGHVVIRDPATGKDLQRVPLGAFKEEEQAEARGVNDFTRCMRGCYPLKSGDPLKFAACCAECSTLLIP